MFLSVVLFVDGEDIICIWCLLYYGSYLWGNFEIVCRSHLCAGLSHFFYFHIWPSDSTIIQWALKFLQFYVCLLILSVELALSVMLRSQNAFSSCWLCLCAFVLLPFCDKATKTASLWWDVLCLTPPYEIANLLHLTPVPRAFCQSLSSALEFQHTQAEYVMLWIMARVMPQLSLG